MKEIIFILSSLNDPHYQNRVEEFMNHGYEVTVYGFKRTGRDLPDSRYTPIVLGEIQNRSFKSRIGTLKSKSDRSQKNAKESCAFTAVLTLLFLPGYISDHHISMKYVT